LSTGIRAGGSSSRPPFSSATTAAERRCSNETFDLTPEIARQAFGDRLKIFAETRRQFDTDNRLLND
jgi:hypothetical protein